MLIKPEDFMTNDEFDTLLLEASQSVTALLKEHPAPDLNPRLFLRGIGVAEEHFPPTFVNQIIEFSFDTISSPMRDLEMYTMGYSIPPTLGFFPIFAVLAMPTITVVADNEAQAREMARNLDPEHLPNQTKTFLFHAYSADGRSGVLLYRIQHDAAGNIAIQEEDPLVVFLLGDHAQNERPQIDGSVMTAFFSGIYVSGEEMGFFSEPDEDAAPDAGSQPAAPSQGCPELN